MKIFTSYRKFLITVFLIFIVAIAGFSYDGTIQGSITGTFNFDDWFSGAGDIELVREILIDDVVGNNNLISLSQIGLLNRSAEDYRMLGDLEAHITRNNRVANNNGFAHIFVRSYTDTTISAWYVLSHYIQIVGGLGTWNHIIYYFTARM